MSRRALITGVAGQDGSYLAELLLSHGYEVVGLVRPPIDRPSENLAGVREAITLLEGDLLEPASLRSAMAQVCPDELYHLAAPTFVPDSWSDPTNTLAAIGGSTATLLAAARELKPAPRIWVAASSEIFGDAGESPQDERSPMRPRTPYGVAKLAAHGVVSTMRAHHGLFACSGITFNHESPRRPPQFLPRKVTRAAAAISLGLESEIVLGDLHAVRDWCHAKDVVRGAWLALQHDEPGDYVLASGVGRTVADLVDAAFRQVGLDPAAHVRVDQQLAREPEPTAPVGDPSHAQDVLGWTLEQTFEQMIADMVATDLRSFGGGGTT